MTNDKDQGANGDTQASNVMPFAKATQPHITQADLSKFQDIAKEIAKEANNDKRTLVSARATFLTVALGAIGGVGAYLMRDPTVLTVAFVAATAAAGVGAVSYKDKQFRDERKLCEKISAVAYKYQGRRIEEISGDMSIENMQERIIEEAEKLANYGSSERTRLNKKFKAMMCGVAMLASNAQIYAFFSKGERIAFEKNIQEMFLTTTRESNPKAKPIYRSRERLVA